MNNIDNLNEHNDLDDYNDPDKNYISTIIYDLEKLGSEKEKDEFIKNYTKIKNLIEKTDSILETTDNSEPDYNLCNIKELFSILESNSQNILNPDKLKTSELKLLLKISNILEEKLNTETINIIELK